MMSFEKRKIDKSSFPRITIQPILHCCKPWCGKIYCTGLTLQMGQSPEQLPRDLFFGENALLRCKLVTVQFPNHLSQKHNTEGSVIDHWTEDLAEINATYLAVTTSHKPGSESPIPLDVKHPLALDESPAFWYVGLLLLPPYLPLIHLCKLFVDCLSPMFPLERA